MAAVALSRLTRLAPHEEHASDCGYCGVPGRRVSYGASARSLDCADYVALCDAGWRRSGNYLYLPTNASTCCPNLTIRLDATRFAPSRAQLRTARRLHEYLRGEAHSTAPAAPAPAPAPPDDDATAVAAALGAVLRDAVAACLPARVVAALGAGACGAVAPLKPRQRHAASAVGGLAPAFTSGVAFAAAAAAAGAAAADAGAAGAARAPPPTAQQLAQAIATAAQLRCAAQQPQPPGVRCDPRVAGALFAAAGPGNINIALPPPPAAGAAAAAAVAAQPSPQPPPPPQQPKRRRPSAAAEGGAGRAPASAVDDAPAAAAAEPPPPPPLPPPPPALAWRVETLPAEFREADWLLYARYQQAVHGDAPSECTRSQYARFLCASPLLRMPFGGGAPLADLDAAGAGAAAAAAAAADTAAAAAAAASAGAAGPAGRALQRCAAGVAAAWRQGEGGGAGWPLVAGADADGHPPAPPVPSHQHHPSDPPSVSGSASSVGRPPQPPCAADSGAQPPPDSAAAVAAAAPAAAAVAAPAGGCRRALPASPPNSPRLPPSPLPLGVLGGGTGAAETLRRVGYGSFHMRYFISEELVAVGVVDVLPHCLSSVYVFYDPVLGGTKPQANAAAAAAPSPPAAAPAAAAAAAASSPPVPPPHPAGSCRSTLELGKVTALYELAWVREAVRASPRLRYYYLGYYVHACAKMRYKAEYAPSELRCPVTGTWVPHAVAAPLLDGARFCRLAPPVPGEPGEAAVEQAATAAAAAAAAAAAPATPLALRGPGGSLQLALPTQLRAPGRGEVLAELQQLLRRTGPAVGARVVVEF
jgi:arginyl-tRNA--protein-N-Asp/Glu arginylyltransferase